MKNLKIKRNKPWLRFNYLILALLIIVMLISSFLFSSCVIFDSCVGNSSSGSSSNGGNDNNNNSSSLGNSGSTFEDSKNQSLSRNYTIYEASKDYKPTGPINEALIVSTLTLDMRDWLSSDFKGNIKLEAKVDLAYSEDFTSPSPTFTFSYYSQNSTSAEYFLGQNIVTVLNKKKKTYSFSLDIYLEGNIIYGARACNYDMGMDGTNILGMYLDYRTYSLNNYYVTVTKI